VNFRPHLVESELRFRACVPFSFRKEVIQPHLPVPLPCYDFVPVASPAFDGAPAFALGYQLQALPTSMT
jgi:hypothetical protein